MILKFEGSLGRPTLISEVSGTPGTLSLMGAITRHRTSRRKVEEPMKTSNVLCCVESTVLQLFFFFIVGVFGLPLAIAGLAADSMCQPCVCSYTYDVTRRLHSEPPVVSVNGPRRPSSGVARSHENWASQIYVFPTVTRK